MNKELKQKILRYVQERIGDFEYGDIDTFLMDEELEDQAEEVLGYIQTLIVKDPEKT